MNADYLQGLYFGIISGIITVLGLIIGLRAGTMSKKAILSGILAISVSDTFADGFALYTSKKAEKTEDKSYGPLKSGIIVVITKLLLAMSFLLPVLFIPDIDTSAVVCLIWGCIVILVSVGYLSILRNENIIVNTSKYLVLTLFIVCITHYSGVKMNALIANYNYM